MAYFLVISSVVGERRAVVKAPTPRLWLISADEGEEEINGDPN